ncbi:hypothetical protein [Paenibacillus sp. UNC499MF]|uniref:hypothetical protein n=1 Tax=Paenibacillus sp. UNC499MF TaxID=1502751 RepID=UPI00089F9854|nr:hypothetical protein [Paenibacillus sp. UNC499MF]SEF95124.1 hypothetical protein SAMN02799616_01555 [Paenibacillus sp. UNC499MF]
MPAVVQWYNATNTSQENSWDIGPVDAGTASTEKTFYIWNNRGGTAAVSDMGGCTITTKDSAGGNTGELVLNKWIEMKCDSMNETTFSPIGGAAIRVIQAGGGAGAGIIKGTANDGTVANSVPNFAKITVRANVPANATAGNYAFLTRINYTI